MEQSLPRLRVQIVNVCSRLECSGQNAKISNAESLVKCCRRRNKEKSSSVGTVFFFLLEGALFGVHTQFGLLYLGGV